MVEIFSARLKWLRESKGFTQKKMAEMIGMTQSSYSKYEYNLREPNLETLAKFPMVLGESTDFLLGVTDLTTNLEGLYNQFQRARDNYDMLKLDLERVLIDPTNPDIFYKDFDPGSKDSVIKKINNLNKSIPLWEQRYEITKEKLLKILAQIPMVNQSTIDGIENYDGWYDMIKDDDHDDQ